MGSAEDATKRRWVFGAYIVYCADPYTARRVYEVAYNRPLTSERFGHVRFEDGACGNWVVMDRGKRGNNTG